MGHRILNQLRRVTSSGSYVPEIDSLRFIAIALVLLVHISLYAAAKNIPFFHANAAANQALDFVQTFGNGVQLFFVISGFILAVPFASHRLCGAHLPSLGKYLQRRITRLEPPYVIAMTGIAVLLIFTRHQPVTNVLNHLLATIFYVHAFIFGSKSTISFVAWSLEIEVQFYLLMPLLAAVYRIPVAHRRRATLIGAIFACIAAQTLLFPQFPRHIQLRLWLSLASHLQYFLAGMFLADLYVTGNQSFGQQDRRWDLVSALGWPGLFLMWYLAPAVSAVIFPAATIILYIAAFRGPFTNRVMRNPWLCTIGGMCYSIYLIHLPLISLTGPLAARAVVPNFIMLSWFLQIALIGVPVLMACSLFFLVGEKPFMRKNWPQEIAAKLRLSAWPQPRKQGTEVGTP